MYVQVVKLSQQWQQLLFLLKAVGSRLKDTRARIERERGRESWFRLFFFCHTKKKKGDEQSTVLLFRRVDSHDLPWKAVHYREKKQFLSILVFFHLKTLLLPTSNRKKKTHRNKKKKKLSDNLLKLLSAHHFSFPPGYISQALCIDLNLGDLTMTD